nr:uncharacterized protein LOC107386627 [Nothobranchius furzeri]
MILTGPSRCLPSPATVQELFSVARDANILPDISLDPVLTTFLSLDSFPALQHQYEFLQRSMSKEQQTTFNLNLTREVGCCRVSYGGVGVIALALSMLFDQVAQQIRAPGTTQGHVSTPRSKTKRMFGIDTSSRIGLIIQSYLSLVPGIANDEEEMAEATELYDNWLKLELLDHYERMTTKKRMSTESMQQWLVGAAIHLHMRIHQVRLRSVPLGSVESLRLSYKTGLNHLIEGYTAYLHRNILEKVPLNPKPGPAMLLKDTTISNVTSSSALIPNSSMVNSADNVINWTTPSPAAGNASGCKTNESRENFGPCVLKGSDNTKDGVNTREEEDSMLGLLVIEPQRKVNHSVQHHPCESPAIQQDLVTRIMRAQDLERNRSFFLYSEKVFRSLLMQKNDFELRTN